MNASLAKDIPFNEKKVKANMFREVEEPFTFDRSIFPIEPTGN